jgi:D-sedoheptulose 7-phosphate isomerase
LIKEDIYKNIEDQLLTSASVKKKIYDECSTSIFKAAKLITEVLMEGGKLMFCGNGGSAADSQHLAAEFLVKLNFDRDALPAIALTTDTSILTAAANDFDFTRIFVRQLEALANEKDLLIGISTSGNSGNVIEAINYCKERGIKNIGMTGKSGGQIARLVELAIKVPSNNVQRIQEGHITIGHILVDIVEKNLFAD